MDILAVIRLLLFASDKKMTRTTNKDNSKKTREKGKEDEAGVFTQLSFIIQSDRSKRIEDLVQPSYFGKTRHLGPISCNRYFSAMRCALGICISGSVIDQKKTKKMKKEKRRN